MLDLQCCGGWPCPFFRDQGIWTTPQRNEPMLRGEGSSAYVVPRSLAWQKQRISQNGCQQAILAVHTLPPLEAEGAFIPWADPHMDSYEQLPLPLPHISSLGDMSRIHDKVGDWRSRAKPWKTGEVLIYAYLYINKQCIHFLLHNNLP